MSEEIEVNEELAAKLAPFMGAEPSPLINTLGPRQTITIDVNRIQADAIRRAADELDRSTRADINNKIGRPEPTYTTADRVADVMWLRARADEIDGVT